MSKSNNRDELTVRVESALDASDATLEAIDFIEGMEAFEEAMLLNIFQVRDKIKDATIFAAGEHFLLRKLADRLGPIIADATQVHYIHDDSWDINPPQEERVVEPHGIAAMELRTQLRELAAKLGAVQNMVKAEKLVADVRTAKF
ncbi:hypothetical protein [Sulfitobacter sp. 1A15106]|uniref:hypothetical protein n=1 Tax=Sulfitobacter sp. 1A15106 TaxID=3368590 RepID=UPI0037470C8A